MEFSKFEKKQWRYLSSKFLPNKKKECEMAKTLIKMKNPQWNFMEKK